jgi:hypothetical protein
MGSRKASGEFLWYGVGHQARLTGEDAALVNSADLGYASTSCDKNDALIGAPMGIGETWLNFFVKKILRGIIHRLAPSMDMHVSFRLLPRNTDP